MDGDEPFLHGYTTAVDDTRRDQDMEMAPLGEFFSRPIKIADISWGSLTTVGSINPWILFFSDPRVENRLTNYNLIRATLKVKAVINGNPFLYGRMLMGYMPYSANESQFSSNNITTFALQEDAVQLSQLPHIYINPTTSTGGVLTCPFFFNKNYANIPTEEIHDLGEIFYITLNTIKHANDPSFRPPTISLFAWAEDVQVSVLTSVDIDTLIPQAGEIQQANKTGVVSGPASSIARVANAMSRIPQIAPYAKATELASSTVASIASRFGYCRPSVTKAPEFMKILQNSSFALTNVPDCSQKLSVDHLQESTVDPRISGIEEDDMLSIVNIAKRESYLTKFVWNDTADSGDFLWNTRVSPGLWLQGPGDSFHFPATAMASLPFRYWTGTLNFRFQVVCSAFHKGRLAVTWDPNWIASSPPELNTLYSEIIDISETQDFTISVANGQAFTLIRNTRPGVTAYSTLFGTSRFTSFEDWSNGVLGVSVINNLTTPNDELGAQIEVNVFVSAGDDFKVFVPYDHFQNFVARPPPALQALVLEEQAGDLLTTSDNNDSSPEGDNTHIMFASEVADHTNLVYTGESIPSFRAMLKRYSLWNAFRAGSAAGETNVASNQKWPIFPFIRGYYTEAQTFTATDQPYAYCNTLLLHWITLGFAGFRGNMRYKLVPRYYTSTNDYSLSVLRFGDEIDPVEYSARSIFTLGAFNTQSEASRSVIRVSASHHKDDFANTGTMGMAWSNRQNGILEFEVPWYSRFRFAGGRHVAWASGDTWGLGGYYIMYRGSASNRTIFDIYAATGEDFQPYFFLGLPRMYYDPSPPPPKAVD